MREPATTDLAPAAIGPYSQAIRFRGALLYVSGQIPLDPETGSLSDGDIKVQTRRVLDNLKEVLAAGGCSLCDVVKTTIFLTDLADFADMNSVYAEYFPTDPPARSTVEVSALPKGARVEIEALAVIPQ